MKICPTCGLTDGASGTHTCPEGMVLVPREPTSEMHNRAHQAEPKAGRQARGRIYKAMLAAAPKNAANADGVRPATLPESLAVLKALHSDRLSPAEKRELQEAIDFIKAATTPHEPPAPKVRRKKSEQQADAALDTRRLDWLDQHCAFVADGEYKIGPFAVGELRQLADAGMAADWVNQRIAAGDATLDGSAKREGQ